MIGSFYCFSFQKGQNNTSDTSYGKLRAERQDTWNRDKVTQLYG